MMRSSLINFAAVFNILNKLVCSIN